MQEQIPKHEEKEQGREKLYEVIKLSIGADFETHAIGKDRIASIKMEVIRMSKYLENSKKILVDLEACADIQTKKEFMERIFAATKPLVDLKINNPKIFIPDGEEDRSFIEVNEVLSYEIGEESISIHILPGEVFVDVFKKFEQGLQKLAEIINENPKIKSIEGSSWIIKKHPKIAERLGFVLDKDSSERATMAREEFLARYLKK